MISTLKGDITGLDFDVIVNAANSQLLPGAGVCGAIFAKAGEKLVEACQKIGFCATGDAVMTDSYDLPCQKILHTVGPVYHGTLEDKHNLKACYWNCLSLAYDYMREQKQEQLSIAFPCISTGIYGYPHKEACAIAVSTVFELMNAYPEARKMNVIFVCYQEQDYLLYKEELRKYAFYGR